jgi:(p)ppGpp synthase/HD superfamily hydrolase
VINVNRIVQAIEFAEVRHRGQYRKPAEERVPYIKHPLAVAALITKCGFRGTDLIVATILHDIIEDTLTTDPSRPHERTGEEGRLALRIEKLFGERVREIVYEVTDDWRIPKDARRAHQREHTYSAEAAALKIADKACNVEDYAQLCERTRGTRKWREVRADAQDYMGRAFAVRERCLTSLDEDHPPTDQLISEFDARAERLREALVETITAV